MSEETKILDINFGDTLQRLIDIKKATEDLAVANDVLKKSVGGDADELAKNAKQLAYNEAQLRALSKEKQALNKIIDTSIAQNNAEVGSIEANRLKLSQLTAEYIKLGKPTVEQTKLIKDLSDKLKVQEGEIGNNTRKVGDYAGGITAASGVLEKFGINTKSIQDKLKSTRDALVETRKRLMDIQGNLGGASGASEGFGKGLLSMTKNLFTSTEGLKILKVALAGIGIGLVVIAIGFLIAAFRKFEPVTNKIEQVVSAVGAAFEVVFGAITKFITAIASGGNLLKSFADSFGGLGDNMKAAAKEAAALTKATQELEDATRRQSLSNSESEKSISNLIIKAKDKTKSDQERIDLLNEAAKIEKDNFDQQVKLADEAVRIAQAQFEQAKKTHQSEDDAEQKAIDAQIARNQLTQQSNDLQEKIANRSNALTEEIATREAKAASDSQASRDKAAADKQKKLDKEKADAEKAAAEKAKIEAETEKATADRLKRQLEQSDQYFQAQRNLELENFNNQVIDKEEFDNRIQELDISSQQDKLNILTAFHQDVTQAELDLQTQLLENNKAYNDAKKAQDDEAVKDEIARNQQIQDDFFKLQQAKLSIASSAADFLGAIVDATGKQGAAAADFAKLLALFQVGVNTAQSISAGIAGATNSALATGPGAFVATPPFIATTVATILGAMAQAITILKKPAPKAPKLAEGGDVGIDVGGESHTRGGTMYVGADGNAFEVERGEKVFVLKKTASEAINKYSTLNQMFGGRSWNGKPVKHAAFGGEIQLDGGITARTSKDNVTAQLSLTDVFKNMPAPVVRVTEINKVQRSVEQSVNVSEL